ncbi:hypothetical protein ABIF65_003895 [Bradyrhizobium japonicum]|nr:MULTISPECIES: hypothetical protein [Bradyrhizobium]MBR0882096.1 hypothetical protein [Bradyrhizobium liaoningense]MBR1002042.1 hypothetical protein [Bradyrhizobium liaoningense]MBR1070630.1 hypothetical protein [Bradyrhizobium liaoningense]MCP1741747.1 hypothetical protein [Bradyrhizobium japonicum]MCP1779428.1 hypothetical protein [Bradyrhizobium japonicum]
MERICLELADGEGVLPLERAGLLLIASNYRAAILDAQAGNRFADTVLTQGLFRRLAFSAKSLIGLGERAGARTQDPVIKRKVLKAFSIVISTFAVDNVFGLTRENGRRIPGFANR